MHSFKRIINKIKNNKGGFSLIEIMVVVFIMVALTSISVGSFAAYNRARSSKISKTLDTLIAQSKIDALSGRENFLLLRRVDNEYLAELYSVNGKSAKNYKQESLGNRWVTITYDNTNTEISETNYLMIRFNQKTGAVEYISTVNNSTFNPENTNVENYTEPTQAKSAIPTENTINIESNNNHPIVLYRDSGEHKIAGEN